MRVPIEWLNEYCDSGLSVDELAERLAMTGTEVERVVRHGVESDEGFVVGKVLTREALLDLLPSQSDEPFDRSIDSRIKRLRSKIEADPRKPALIKTVHGSGYLLAADGGER